MGDGLVQGAAACRAGSLLGTLGPRGRGRALTRTGGVVGPICGGFVGRDMCFLGGIEIGRIECVMYIYIL